MTNLLPFLQLLSTATIQGFLNRYTNFSLVNWLRNGEVSIAEEKIQILIVIEWPNELLRIFFTPCKNFEAYLMKFSKFIKKKKDVWQRKQKVLNYFSYHVKIFAWSWKKNGLMLYKNQQKCNLYWGGHKQWCPFLKFLFLADDFMIQETIFFSAKNDDSNFLLITWFNLTKIV